MAAPMRVRAPRLCQICKCFPSSFLRCSSSTTSKRKWEGVVGLEIHAQILAESKLFSGACTKFGGTTNNQVSLFDAAFPGTLPAINRRCVEAGGQTALALNCQINKVSKFDRKHYFYADLPAGYQITQLRQPLAKQGSLRFPILRGDISPKCPLDYMTVRLEQIQLEQDSGKSIHNEDDKQSLIDLNRAGVGLMEIITAPDLSSGLESVSFLRELIGILTTVSTCNCKMEEGSFRVDANISVHQPGEPLGTRVEVKNLNSIRSVKNAIDYEIRRQKQQLQQGKQIINDTRSWDVSAGLTLPMRDKEIELDYRFMPEPNLPPLHVYDNTSIPAGLNPSQIVNIDVLQQQLPPLPAQQKQDLVTTYGLPELYAHRIEVKPGMRDYYKKVVEARPKDPIYIAVRMMGELLGEMNKKKLEFNDITCSPETFGEACDLRKLNAMTTREFEKVVEDLLENPPSETHLNRIRKRLLMGSRDSDEQLESICRQVLEDFEQGSHLKNAKLKRNPEKLLIFLAQQATKKSVEVRFVHARTVFKKLLNKE
ncbi:glutamyl-tRNA(Gln) amidotransferase subunit B, mitochondrial-like [Mizuhopecten yessoensis]|uniref:Glutamyl-tRNA(Gln) amidotransferase subunit B, mitochondrial n=1 Tax=Mizuhopecten yessoensis TaxID=6573 RepID=A0A210QYX0_MIZYE|nr:glutamyl-tRNA(Gln) amidotransferase subunit B, mitochondrial-like [Mizuhopecten yessoensis]OWF53917.1 Glutamyl-tRNA(Gln) amidotransferase subunit B, mitochondrial [Mizuhopecten yessoensis]